MPTPSVPALNTLPGRSLPRPPGAPGRPGRLIQIVEDDAPLGAALAAALELNGFRTLYAANASASLEQAHAHRPDLILCDINMPGRNGHLLLQDLRHDPELADCQFVFMTGNTVYAHPRYGMDLGADDFLLKPFTMEALVSCINARLRRADVTKRHEELLIAELRRSLSRTLPHEFFTPLTGIMGLLDVLEEERDSLRGEEAGQILQDARRCGRRLHRTLRNYLSILDASAPSGTPQPLAPDFVAATLRAGAMAAAERHDRVADLQLEIEGAALHLPQSALSMLTEEVVDNGFSFSTAGQPVTVRAWATRERLVLTVQDRGRGMTAAQLQQLQAFQQFERQRFEQQGLGLGLTLVCKLLLQHGGDLRLDSKPGEGTLCRVELPRVDAPAVSP